MTIIDDKINKTNNSNNNSTIKYNDPKSITSGIPLLPFTNQVGGHTSIFRFSKRTICKPASQKEQQVYVYLESHHPELLPFLSQYLGVLNVTYHQNQPNLLPEVIFAKNEQLLDDWKSIAALPSPSNDILDQDFQSGSPNADECNNRFDAFRQRVLHEALSPNALKERIQKIQEGWSSSTHSGSIEKMTMTQKKPSMITATTSAPPSPKQLSAAVALKTPARETSQDNLLSAPPQHFRANSSTIPSSSNNKDEETKVTYSSLPMISQSNSLDQVPPLSPQQETTPSATSAAPSPSSRAHWQPRRAPTNPWSQQVYERDRQKLLTKGEDDVVKQFILLEDLTDAVEYPCVLDLKMGSRQHSVDSTESKMQSQTCKCALSTSQQLGVRVCGMQVYHPDRDQFEFFDKYLGRSLTVASFKTTLRDYFNNNTHMLDQIPILVRKLTRLSRIIQNLKGYRFYGSSLLVIYDGSGKKTKIDVRMIDFAKSVTPQDNTEEFTYPPERPTEPDHGYLLGLKSLMDCFNDIYQEHVEVKGAQ